MSETVEKPTIPEQAKHYFVSYAATTKQGIRFSDCPIKIVGMQFPIQSVINAIQEQVLCNVSLINWIEINESQFNEVVQFRQKPKLATPDKKIITP